MPRRFLPIALALASIPVASVSLRAQSILDIGARIAPQFHSYDIKSPANTKVSEFSVPLFVVIPITSAFTFDVGTAYARAQVDQTTGGKTTTSEISGLTDTQVRANYTIGSDLVVITGGVNIPTGQSTVTAPQLLAGGLIGSDFLNFPISNMGTGFGGTGGIAFALPVGDWSLGLGTSMRHAAQYDPFDLGGATALHYRPGNEYRVRGGVDHTFGTGRINLGLTYSTFGNDNLAGSIYNTGNRWLTQFGLNNTFGPGELTLVGWNLFREAGTLADSSYLGHENIVNTELSYGVTAGTVLIEPNIEGRMWTQSAGRATSTLGTIGLRSQMSLGGLRVVPSIGYSIGRLAQASALDATASMTGLHGALTIRVR